MGFGSARPGVGVWEGVEGHVRNNYDEKFTAIGIAVKFYDSDGIMIGDQRGRGLRGLPGAAAQGRILANSPGG